MGGIPKFTIEEDDLYYLYIIKNKRRSEVANIYGCSDVLIKKKIQEYGIQKPSELEVENKKRRSPISCENCGTTFYVTSFRTKNEKWKSKFCSPECSSRYRFLGWDHKRKMRNGVAARNRARRRNQTPNLTEDEIERIKKIYAECPDGYEVDHIFPVSKGGLHHPDNLQYLTPTENREKSNHVILEETGRNDG